MSEIYGVQLSIMVFVKKWVNTEKTPVPRKEIMRYVLKKNMSPDSAVDAIKYLMIKGYLRKAYNPHGRISTYVMTGNI